MFSAKQTWLRYGLFASLLAWPTLLLAADRSVKNLRAPNPDDRTVEMFEGIESQDIEVKIIPKDSTEARVLIKNNTNKPLNVKLPEVFAGVPVLAQQRGLGGRGGGRGGMGGGGQQAMGGGMMGGGGMGMGMMNVPPEQVGQFKVATVCLEHGKKEPRAQVPYEIVPLANVTTKPGVKELLSAFGKQQINQRAAQAATWHLANDMSWEELITKRIEHLNGTSESWFNAHEIQLGMHLAHAAAVEAEAAGLPTEAEAEPLPPKSPGELETGLPPLTELAK